MNAVDERATLFGQVSLWQLIVLTAIFAALFSIICAVGMHSANIYAFLLLPTLVFVALKLVGVVFRPATTVANRPAIVLTAGVMLLLLGFSVVDLARTAIILPLASIWMAQVVALHIWVGRSTPSHASTYADLLLVGCLLLITVGMGVVYCYSLAYHLSGSGTLLNSYWLVSTAQHHTLYDCQIGYDGHPWRFNSGYGSSISGRSDPDWSFLGLERYRIKDNRGATHIPHWIPLGLAITYPAFWLFARIREAGTSRQNAAQ